MIDKVLSQFTPEKVEEEVNVEKKFRYGIIGTGWIAEAHADALNLMDDVEVVALADLVPGKAETFAKNMGWDVSKIHFYTSCSALFSFIQEILLVIYTVCFLYENANKITRKKRNIIIVTIL